MSKYSLFTLAAFGAAMVFAQALSSAVAVGAVEDFNSIHQRMGATGKNGYRPMSSRAYQNTAQVHARALNSYGRNCEQVPVETVHEHVTQIRTSVAATKKEIAKLPPEAVATEGIKEHLDAIAKHLATCEKMCAMAEKSVTDAKSENVAICTHCVDLEKELKALQKEEDALLKKLGITIPKEADHHDEHEHDIKKK